MEQMTELLKAILEKMNANLKEMKEDIKTNQEKKNDQDGCHPGKDDGQNELPARPWIWRQIQKK
jgi:hypothetical protein